MAERSRGGVGLLVSPEPATSLAELSPLLSDIWPGLVLRTHEVGQATDAGGNLASVVLVVVDSRKEGAGLGPGVSEIRAHSNAPIVVLRSSPSALDEVMLACGADEVCGAAPEEIATAIRRGLARRHGAAKLRAIAAAAATNLEVARRGNCVEEALQSDLRQLEEARDLEALGRLAGRAAHDFNNVITVVSSYAFLIAKKLADHDPLQGPVAEIGKATERATHLTRKLLALTRRTPRNPRVFDLNPVVRGLEVFLRRLLGERVTLTFALHPESVMVYADPGQVEQLIMDLAMHARDTAARDTAARDTAARDTAARDTAAPEGGSVTIRTRKEARTQGSPAKMPWLLEVADFTIRFAEASSAKGLEPPQTQTNLRTLRSRGRRVAKGSP